MKLFGMSFAFLLVLYHDAFAYLDPGTGSYVLQVLAATIVGSFFAIKLYWDKIKHKVKGSNNDDTHS